MKGDVVTGYVKNRALNNVNDNVRIEVIHGNNARSYWHEIALRYEEEEEEEEEEKVWRCGGVEVWRYLLNAFGKKIF